MWPQNYRQTPEIQGKRFTSPCGIFHPQYPLNTDFLAFQVLDKLVA
jgi:hypothetical protein